MTRPARPGEVGIIISDALGRGRNVGKKLFCVQQCCIPFFHKFRILETLTDAVGQTLERGESVCLAKEDVIVLEDPDKAQDTDTFRGLEVTHLWIDESHTL